MIVNFNETIRVGGFREAAIAIIIKADAITVAGHCSSTGFKFAIIIINKGFLLLIAARITITGYCAVATLKGKHACVVGTATTIKPTSRALCIGAPNLSS